MAQTHIHTYERPTQRAREYETIGSEIIRQVQHCIHATHGGECAMSSVAHATNIIIIITITITTTMTRMLVVVVVGKNHASTEPCADTHLANKAPKKY
jgi:hypothetical protein